MRPRRRTRAVTTRRTGTALALAAAVLAAAALPVAAQQVTLDFGGGDSLTLRAVQLFAAVTLLALAPGIAVMITSFPFIVTVLSILRQALGMQQSPPNMLIVSLALFLTWFIMEPVFTEAWSAGIAPLVAGEAEPEAAFTRALEPFRGFMAARIDPETLAELASLRAAPEAAADPTAAPLSLLVPAFMLSEIARAFQIGFLIFLPFLIIDLVTAAVLMSMGMMMVPPAIVSLPFKLAFFVMADGWALLSGALVRSYL